MARPPRHNEPGTTYHSYNRAARREDMFADDEDCRMFIRFLVRELSRHPIELLAFCLMGNHYHLMLRCLEACLDAFMRDFTARYVTYFNSRHGYDGRQGRDRYQSKPVFDPHYARTLNLYIHRNPADIGWADKLDRYPWSSLGFYLQPDQSPHWLKTDMVLELFGGQKGYEAGMSRFIDLGTAPDASPEDIYASWAIRRIGEVIRAVADETGVDPGTLTAAGPDVCDERSAALVLAQESTDLPLETLGAVFGYASAPSICRALTRARRALESSPEVEHLVVAAKRRLS